METRREGPGPDALRRASREASAAGRIAARGDREGAAARLTAAVAELGPLAVLCAPLAAVLRGLGRWQELAELCREAGATCADLREGAAWQLRLAEACEALGDVDGAVAAHRAALAAWPREIRALRALQRLHRIQGDHAALARALEGELSLRAGDEEISLRVELAQLLAGPLARGAEALVHLRRVLDLEPRDADTLARALGLAETLGAATEQVDLLDVALAQGGESAQRARILARQAALLSGPLGNPEHAIPRWRQALQLEPSLPGAREGLRSALEQVGDWPGLLDCLHEESRAAGPEARRALLERAAQIAALHLGADAALPWLERLRAEAPRDPTIVARIADIHRRAGRTAVWMACIDAELALSPGPARVLELEEQRTGLDAVGRRTAEPAASLSATSARIPRRRTRARRVRVLPLALAPLPDDPDAVARTTEEELAALDPDATVFAERRRALRLRLARLYADALQDAERALPHLRALVSDDDASAAHGIEAEAAWAEDRLLVCLRAEGSHAELAERLAARLARWPDDPTGWLELARLHEHWLHAPAAAADAYRTALVQGAASEEALAGLRRSAEALGDYAEVARALELEIADETTARVRATLLRTLGEVTWRRLGATTRASRAFAAALESDPRDLVSLRALQQLLASMEDWRGALDLIESETELLPQDATEARRRLWLRAAGIAADRIGDPDRAVRALDAANALAPLDRVERQRLADLLHAAGNHARYVEVARALCDEAGARPDASAELRLALALRALGHLDAARTRVKRALAAAPQLAGAWELLADIRLAQGAPEDAAESLVRAAENAGPAAAVSHLLHAASLAEGGDPEFAHGLREGACRRDAGSVAAHAARARSALALGRGAEAEEAALRAAELALAPPARHDTHELLETGLAVAAAARDAGRLAVAARLLEALQAVAPDHAAALRAQAEVLFALGDRSGARRAVATLFARDEASRKDARLLVVEAEGLEHEAAFEEATERYAEAATLDPSLEPAWSGLARGHERAGRPLEAIRALDACAQGAPPHARLACQLRAAELALAHVEGEAAVPRLQEILRDAPACTRAAELLASRLLQDACPADALDVAVAALAHAEDPGSRSALARLRARALEALARVDEAGHAWAAVLESDPGAVDAVRARAALLRGAGLWREAAASLESFLGGPRPVAPEALADLWLALARLRAGPLREADGARTACAEAVRLDPGSRAARETLADLLATDPAHRAEAIARHRELLDATPDRVRSIEALTCLAKTGSDPALAADGQVLLRVLGACVDDDAPPARLRLRVVGAAALENPVWERARQMACVAARPISRALEASETLEPPRVEGAREAFRLAAIVAEAELAGPALVPLRDEEAGAVLSTVAALASEPEVVSGDGRLVNALSATLGRAARRRVREALGGASPAEIADIDFPAWRAALRALAHAVALDATGGDLRSALDALADEDGAASPSAAARDLLRRAVAAFGREVAGDGGAA